MDPLVDGLKMLRATLTKLDHRPNGMSNLLIIFCRHELKGKKDFHKLLAKEITRSEQALKKLLDAPLSPERESGLRAACQGKADLFESIKPWGNLIRTDSMGRYQVYLEGSRYVSDSSERRGSGTHYTPRFLAEEMVQHTLEPLIVEGMADGWPQEEWRKKSATELLNLRIADIAMGSGAFLVAVCRFLSAKVVEAWNEAEGTLRNEVEGARLVCNEAGELQIAFDPNHPDRRQVETSLGTLTVADPKRNEALPTDEEERLAVARSMIVDRCLYGVDINPMATEMAKLSLWLITMRKDKPFHFLDHALKCGDSLVGVTLDELKAFSLENDSKKGGSVLLPWIPEAVERVKNLREQIRRWPGNTAIGVENRRILHSRAEEDEVALRVAADLLLSEAFTKATNKEQRQELLAARQARLAMLQERPDREKAERLGSILGRPSFHFELEFADVFAEGGFDAIVGNPPFVGGNKITTAMSTPFRDYIVARIAGGQRGSADLSAYFFLRAAPITKASGCIGLLATNTISEGDTREVGLDYLLKSRSVKVDGSSAMTQFSLPPIATAYRAVKSMKWPSKSANLDFAKVWLCIGEFLGPKKLDSVPVNAISPLLRDESVSENAFRLSASKGICFKGVEVNGMAFVISEDVASNLQSLDSNNAAVVVPYINGDDLNSATRDIVRRFVIYFRDWPLGRVNQHLPASGIPLREHVRLLFEKQDIVLANEQDRWASATPDQQAEWLKVGLVPIDYPGPVAADFKSALAELEREGIEERSKNAHPRLRQTWWRFKRLAVDMQGALTGISRCLCKTRHASFHSFSWVTTSVVISEAMAVIASESDAMFGVVQSMWHQVWADKYGSTLGHAPRYTPSDCFETFPLPDLTEQMDAMGKALDDARRAAMDARQIGLTDVSKLMHSPTVRDADIEALRQAVIANDAAVSAAYGWDDLDLEHDFYDLGRGPRFTVSPAARKEMLRRLLAENHRRYAEEQAELAAHPDSTKTKKGKAKRKPDSSQGTMFGDGELTDGEADH